MSEPDAITEILNSSKTIAVVGLSSNRMRASFHVAEYLKSVGYQIIPVNPNETAVLGEKSYARLQEVPVSIDVVEIFRRPAFVPEIVEAAIQIKRPLRLDAGRNRKRRGGRTCQACWAPCGHE